MSIKACHHTTLKFSCLTGVAAISVSPCLRVPCPRVPAPPRPRVSVSPSPRPRVSASPRLRVSVSPCLRVPSSGSPTSALCYNPPSIGQGKLSELGVFLRHELAATKRMLKRISDAKSQSNITELPPASDFHRSHQSHCNFSLIPWLSVQAPCCAQCDRRLGSCRRG
jgi:hypothetical protein